MDNFHINKIRVITGDGLNYFVIYSSDLLSNVNAPEASKTTKEEEPAYEHMCSSSGGVDASSDTLRGLKNVSIGQQQQLILLQSCRHSRHACIYATMQMWRKVFNDTNARFLRNGP
jgi:hypothetical protein